MIRILAILLTVWSLGYAGETPEERYIVVKSALHVGMPEIALAELDNMPQQKRDAEYWLQRGRALEQLGRFEEALEAFSKRISLRPRDAAGYNGMGTAYSASGDLASGEAYLRKATQLAPMEAGYYHDLAKTYILEGKYEKAQKSLELALRLGGGAEVAKHLAQTLALRGEKEQAKALLMRYFDMPEVYCHLAEAYELGGDLPAAIEHYHLALLAAPDYPPAAGGLKRLTGVER